MTVYNVTQPGGKGKTHKGKEGKGEGRRNWDVQGLHDAQNMVN